MNIKRIVDDFARAQTDQQTKSAQERQKLKATREANSKATSGHLRTVVEPVLRAACAEVERSGYPASFESSDTAESLAGSENLLTLTMRASNAKKLLHKQLSPFLSYAGNFNDLSINMYQRSTLSEPGDERRLPLNEVTKATVEAQVEAFLKALFRVPGS